MRRVRKSRGAQAMIDSMLDRYIARGVLFEVGGTIYTDDEWSGLLDRVDRSTRSRLQEERERNAVAAEQRLNQPKS